jgi:hypothetical protein
MVDQAQITTANGQTELPPRAVARNTAEFFHDVTTLGELQAKLALVDFREGLARLLTPVIVLALGVAVGLGAVPIALAALALTIATTTELSLAACFGIALLAGLVLCAVLVVPAIFALRSGLSMFERSRYELGRNMKWVKDTLRRLSQGPPQPIASRSARVPW